MAGFLVSFDVSPPVTLDSVPNRRATKSFSLKATNSNYNMPLMIFKIPYQKGTSVTERWLCEFHRGEGSIP